MLIRKVVARVATQKSPVLANGGIWKDLWGSDYSEAERCPRVHLPHCHLLQQSRLQLDALALAVDIILQGPNGDARDEGCVIVEYTKSPSSPGGELHLQSLRKRDVRE